MKLFMRFSNRRKIKILCLFFFIFFFASLNLKAQNIYPDSLLIKIEQFGKYLLYKNHDSTYIANYSENFTLKLIAVNKFNFFRIIDRDKNSSIRYRPDRQLNIGIGLAHKWFAFDLALNVGITEVSNFSNKKFLDVRANVFSSKHIFTATLKYYYGYQMKNFSGVTPPEIPVTSTREDIRTVYLGFQYLFAFNYDKFSVKAPFIFNEMQRKSAGSFLIGAGFNLFVLGADSTVVPVEVQDSFNEKLHLQDLNSISLSVNFGYIYTFVFKQHFFLTLSLSPGIGVNMGDSQTEFRETFKTHMFLGLRSMNSVGYNARRFFGGVQLIGDAYNIRIDKNLITQVGNGNIKFFVGYRFGHAKE